MMRTDLIVVGTFITFLVLSLSCARWAWTSRTSVKGGKTMQNTSEERSEISTTGTYVMDNSTTQNFLTSLSTVTEISMTHNYTTELNSVQGNTTEISSKVQSTKQPTKKESFNDRLIVNRTDLKGFNISTESSKPFSLETQIPQFHTNRSIGIETTTISQTKNGDKTKSINIEQNSNLTGENYSLYKESNSKLTTNNTKHFEPLEHLNLGMSEKGKALNESVGFQYKNISNKNISDIAQLNKSAVGEVLIKENHTNTVTAPIFENVTVLTTVETAIGLNSSISDEPVSFAVGQQSDNSSQTTNSTDDDVDYVKMGQELVSEAIMVLDTGIWEFERRTEDGDVIFSRKLLDTGNTVYRLTGIVDMPAQDLLVILYDGLADYPKWNPTLLECRVLEKINDQTDISYTVSAPGARGYVASRDFVSLRHWDVYQNTFVAATKSIDFQNAPFNPDYIRADIRGRRPR